MSRLLEAFGAGCWVFLWLCAFLGPLLWVYVLYSKYWYLSLIYAAWIYYDRETGRRGGRRCESMRRLPVWRWFCAYFPMRIVKTTDLDPSKNYLLVYHPHGMYCAGVHGNFGFEGNRVSEVFPGLKIYCLTMDFNFRIPIFREICLAGSACSVSRESMNFLLSKPGGGNGVLIIPGGAREALYCEPGTDAVYLRRRKGFIKVAIQNGSPLVPIYTFGETDIYSQPKNPKGSLLRKMEDKCVDIVGAVPIFGYGDGLLPRRQAITSVVGAPIPVEKQENPSPEYIESLHEKYVKTLKDLYHKYREQYGHPDSELIIY